MLMIYKTLSVISHTLDASSPEWGSLMLGGEIFLLLQKARPSGELSPSGD